MTLKEIIEELGNKNYPIIMVRYFITIEGTQYDELFGYCSYNNGVLESLDGDTYSLDEKFDKWEEWVRSKEEFADNGQVCLTVWWDEDKSYE